MKKINKRRVVLVLEILLSFLFCVLCALSVRAADFNDAIFVILKHEGHISVSPSDPGGITSYGLSLRYLTGLVNKSPEIEEMLKRDQFKYIDAYDIKHLRIEDAIKIYREYWWEPEEFHVLNSQALAIKLFDIWVNLGAGQGQEILYKAYQRTTGEDWRSLDEINKLSKAKQIQLMANLKAEQRLFYENLVKEHPVYRKFLKGWLKRASE
jgi:lysozyme family protein